MLYLMTGLPGHGKTLNTLKYISENKDFKGRQVYYNGIPELKIEGWEEFDNPDSWFDLPDGSIIVIDECQRVFPPRKVGAAAPRKVSEFETHRHKGYDIFLITQHPNLLDSHVRRLVGKHIHVFRPANGPAVTMYQWDQASDPKNYHDKKQADTKIIRLDKKYYGQYKSTVLNTHKLKFPRKLLIIPPVVGVLVYCVYSVYAFIDEKQAPDLTAQQQINDLDYSPSSLGVKPAVFTGNPYSDSQYKPRFDHDPSTAPIYDSLFEVVSKPDIHCISNTQLRCLCYDQQMIKYQYNWKQCKLIMAGRFDPSKPDRIQEFENNERFDYSKGRDDETENIL